jgi:hypothetical protein
MLGGVAAEVCMGREAEAGAVEFKCPATCLARKLILSRGLVGFRGVFSVGATVTNVTADCLHGTGVGIATKECNWGATRPTGKSRSSDRWPDMQLNVIYPVVFG